MLGIITGATCGDNCWYAREDTCRCSCGGANHGCLLTADGIKPERTSRIEGFMYTLTGSAPVASLRDTEAYRDECRNLQSELIRQADALNKASGFTYYGAYNIGGMNARGTPAKIRTATKSQVANWPELAAYRSNQFPPYLLWTRKV